MSTTMKTPGVYIQELDAFGNSVVPVPTAVPAFIGYTGQTSFNGKSLLNKAVRVTSLMEFFTIFGNTAPQVQYEITSNILPDRLNVLEADVASTKAALDAADEVVKKAGDKATPEQKQAAADAKTANDAANKALTDAQADPNIKALLSAQDALAKNDDPAKAPDLEKAVKEAQAVFDKIINNADFSTGGYAYNNTPTTINYRLYSAIKFFYENGGGTCYIMSIGGYDYSKKAITDTTDFMNAITLLKKESEPTMLVIPDAVEVIDPTADPTSATYLQAKYANAYSLQNEMINHCGEMMSRVAILDVPGGYTEPLVGTTSVEQFRNSVEPLDPKFNSYAAIYYPWLHTTVYQTSEISYNNIDKKSYDQVTQMLTIEFTNKKGVVDPNMAKIISAFSTDTNNPPQVSLEKADTILQNLSKSYQLLTGAIMGNMNLMAPSAAMAGIYTSVDNNEGVWKAPANVGVQSTIAPSIKIDNEAQENLNVPIDGKSVSAIRAFAGRGNLVWGARTLDGNSNDWRYINVRRTLIYIEQSVKEAAKAYVFAPNDASTWVAVQSMISNFLTGLWNQGGLVGPKATDAFSVSVGLGSTMTGQDILDGIMRVAVKVAVSHPAEFIEITFQQEMQKG